MEERKSFHSQSSAQGRRDASLDCGNPVTVLATFDATRMTTLCDVHNLYQIGSLVHRHV